MNRLIVKTLDRLKLLRHFNFTFSHKRDSRTVRIPVIRTVGRENLHISEWWMCEVLQQLLSMKKGCFIDIGVNLGQSLIKLKLVDETVAYVGFDPNPVCVYYTNELIRENRYENAVVVPAGISSDSGLLSLNFYADSDSDGSASIVRNFRPTEKVFRREFVACFDFRKIEQTLPIANVAVIKIDVEGAELEVLGGIRRLLSEKRPFVLIEILPVYSRDNTVRWTRQQQLEAIVKDCDYRIFFIDKSYSRFHKYVELETIGVNDDPSRSDYILSPTEDVAKIMMTTA